MAEQTCPNCGMDQEQWSANKGEGYNKSGKTYCCQGCAEKGQENCTCLNPAP